MNLRPVRSPRIGTGELLCERRSRQAVRPYGSSTPKAWLRGHWTCRPSTADSVLTFCSPTLKLSIEPGGGFGMLAKSGSTVLDTQFRPICGTSTERGPRQLFAAVNDRPQA
jgi:hypothetical protein